MKHIFRTILLASASFIALACGNNSSKTVQQPVVAQTDPLVTVVSAQMREVPQEQTYTSTVQAYVVNNIAPQTPSRIKKILVDVGDFVKEGQLVAEMDVMNLLQLKLQLVNDSTELVRLKALYDEGGISRSDFEAAEMGYNVRKSSYDNLVENTYLRAPISGVITARNYDVGDLYAGQPLYVIQQITPVKLFVGISESEYTKVKKGDKVTLVADAFPGEEFTGRIDKIHPTIDPATRTFTVEVKVDNRSKQLRPGMFARVKVTFGKDNSVIVPDIAVIKQQGSGERFVYVLNSDNTVTYKKIELGVRLGNEYQILSGLQEGDRVVTEGQLRLKDGIKVNVKK